MNIIRIIFVSIVVIFSITGCSLTNNKNISETFNSKSNNKKTIIVDYVIDGDTFISNNKKYRLILVDTPESKHRNMNVQPYALESSAYTKEQIEGEKVGIEYGIQEIDKYGNI